MDNTSDRSVWAAKQYQSIQRVTYLQSVFDYTLAGVGFILFLPASLLIALAIRLESSGAVLFKQKHRGCNNRIFAVFKFRTMRVCEGKQKVTRIGGFLRRTSLDQLPLLINVLRGELSIVGPGTHALANYDYYPSSIGNYASREWPGAGPAETKMGSANFFTRSKASIQ